MNKKMDTHEKIRNTKSDFQDEPQGLKGVFADFLAKTPDTEKAKRTNHQLNLYIAEHFILGQIFCPNLSLQLLH